MDVSTAAMLGLERLQLTEDAELAAGGNADGDKEEGEGEEEEEEEALERCETPTATDVALRASPAVGVAATTATDVAEELPVPTIAGGTCEDASPAAAARTPREPAPVPPKPCGELQPQPPAAAAQPPLGAAPGLRERAWESEPTREELADQIYAQMRLRETEGRQWVPCGGFWQGLLVYRGNVVDWLYEACESLRLRDSVLHLAVHYLDWTMLAIAVPQADMQTLCMACVLAAAKFQGPEHCVPALETVMSFARCTEKDICDMELRVLFALDWRLNPVTTLQVVEHHLELGVVVQRDGCGDSARPTACLTNKVRKLSEFFLLQALYEHRFLESPATLCGAAALAAARETLGLEPWPQLLEQRSGYTRPSVVALAEDVLEQAHTRFPDEFFRDAGGQWVAVGIARHEVADAKDKAATTDMSPPASPVADAFDRSTVGPGS
eukprot:COSAG02_NODE_146_length_33985_cov_263.461695_13_plen_440_part_00